MDYRSMCLRLKQSREDDDRDTRVKKYAIIESSFLLNII
jgi:hypothetical protein